MPRGTAFAAAAAALLSAPAGAGGECTRDAMLVFDGSGSMAEMGFNAINEPRIFEAREAVARAVPEIARARRLGLIVYGPGPQGPCGNVDVRFAPREDAAGAIIAAVNALAPEGETPLTDAVAAAAEVLAYRDKPGEIVLVTDGKETCGGEPCLLAADLAAEARDLTIHVIGFKARGGHFSFGGAGAEEYAQGTTVARCLADRTGGFYISAETAEELAEAFLKTLGCRLIAWDGRLLALHG